MLNNFKFIKNITDGGEATIVLYNQIGDSINADGNYTVGISGTAFANEMQYLQNNSKKINVRINSIGGSVMDGYSIISSILNSQIPVDTYIDGIAASIAGVVAVSGKKVYMMDYGTLMLHDPSGTDDKKLLSFVKDTLTTILSNRTNKTIEEVSLMMTKETWMSAQEAMDNGMIDEVISSGKKIKMKKSDSLQNMAIIYNKYINKQPKMEKITNVLKLKNEADESEIVVAIENKDKENESLKNELEVLKTQIEENKIIIENYKAEKIAKEEAELELLKNKATNLVVNAIKEGKLNESEKETTILNAAKDEASFTFVSNFISRLGNGKESKKPFDIKNFAGDDRSKWTFSDWSNKDAKGLAEMKNSNPEAFEEICKSITKIKSN